MIIFDLIIIVLMVTNFMIVTSSNNLNVEVFGIISFCLLILSYYLQIKYEEEN